MLEFCFGVKHSLIHSRNFFRVFGESISVGRCAFLVNCLCWAQSKHQSQAAGHSQQGKMLAVLTLMKDLVVAVLWQSL